MTSLGTAACTSAVGFLLAVAPAAAQMTAERLGATEMFQAADVAEAAGRREDALTLLAALTRDPDLEVRSEARFRLAMLFAGAQRYADAAKLFRALLDEKPGATRVRLELGRVLAAMGDEAGARRAIRRAQASGLAPDVAAVVDQFAAALRSPKRLGGSLQLAFAPDSNVNRATDARTLDTVIAPLTLSRDARERSGLGLRVSGQGFVRVALSDHLALFPRLSGSAALYRASDFNDVSTSALLGLEWQSGRDRITPAIGPTWRWYGKRFYARTDTAALDWLHPIGRRAQLSVSASAARAKYRRNPLQTGRLFDLSATLERALSARSGFGGTLGATRQTARDQGYSTIAGYVAVTGWRDAGRTTLFANALVRRTEGDERLFLFPERRREWLQQVGVGATFRALAVRGFAPLLRLTLERNSSTVGLYEYRRLAADIGIARAF